MVHRRYPQIWARNPRRGQEQAHPNISSNPQTLSEKKLKREGELTKDSRRRSAVPKSKPSSGKNWRAPSTIRTQAEKLQAHATVFFRLPPPRDVGQRRVTTKPEEHDNGQRTTRGTKAENKYKKKSPPRCRRSTPERQVQDLEG